MSLSELIGRGGKVRPGRVSARRHSFKNDRRYTIRSVSLPKVKARKKKKNMENFSLKNFNTRHEIVRGGEDAEKKRKQIKTEIDEKGENKGNVEEGEKRRGEGKHWERSNKESQEIRR